MPYGIDLRVLGERDQWTCWVCGGEVTPSTPQGSPHGASVDHVIPRSRGGSNDRSNLRLAHRRCNGQRGSRIPELLWPKHLTVLDPAPLWPVLQRALRRPGEWELVAAVGEVSAEEAERWLRDAVTAIVGGVWETRTTRLQPALLSLSLRVPAAIDQASHRGHRLRGRAAAP